LTVDPEDPLTVTWTGEHRRLTLRQFVQATTDRLITFDVDANRIMSVGYIHIP
jgi:hypothetical protein